LLSTYILKIRIHWNFLASRFKFVLHIKILSDGNIVLSPVWDRRGQSSCPAAV